MSDNKGDEQHRVSCHRCGNIRKRKVFCSRSSCPHTFCGRCADKMKEDYGPAIFNVGCPVCQELCCCSNKSNFCDRKNHCYRKCPASRSRLPEKGSKFDLTTHKVCKQVHQNATINHNLIVQSTCENIDSTTFPSLSPTSSSTDSYENSAGIPDNLHSKSQSDVGTDDMESDQSSETDLNPVKKSQYLNNTSSPSQKLKKSNLPPAARNNGETTNFMSVLSHPMNGVFPYTTTENIAMFPSFYGYPVTPYLYNQWLSQFNCQPLSTSANMHLIATEISDTMVPHNDNKESISEGSVETDRSTVDEDEVVLGQILDEEYPSVSLLLPTESSQMSGSVLEGKICSHNLHSSSRTTTNFTTATDTDKKRKRPNSPITTTSHRTIVSSFGLSPPNGATVFSNHYA